MKTLTEILGPRLGAPRVCHEVIFRIKKRLGQCWWCSSALSGLRLWSVPLGCTEAALSQHLSRVCLLRREGRKDKQASREIKDDFPFISSLLNSFIVPHLLISWSQIIKPLLNKKICCLIFWSFVLSLFCIVFCYNQLITGIFFFWDRDSLCGTGWPKTHYADQPGLKLIVSFLPQHPQSAEITGICHYAHLKVFDFSVFCRLYLFQAHWTTWEYVGDLVTFYLQIDILHVHTQIHVHHSQGRSLWHSNITYM